MISSKKGKLYLQLILAAAILASLIFALYAIAAPVIEPALTTSSNLTSNVSSMLPAEQLFMRANYSSVDVLNEGNSTFKHAKKEEL